MEVSDGVEVTSENYILRLCYAYFVGGKRSDKGDKRIEAEIKRIIERFESENRYGT